MFSEVKGPGDRLSETQENWIDFLSGLGGQLEVELCHLKEVTEDGTSVVPRKDNTSSNKDRLRKDRRNH